MGTPPINHQSRNSQVRSFPFRTGLAITSLFFVQLLWGNNVAGQIETGYGRHTGSSYRTSVNGTSGLAEMYRASDFKVKSWRKLSPRINNFDTIVWFPDRIQAPSKEEFDELKTWLTEESDRTLIIIGREFDAEEAMWQNLLTTASSEQKVKMRRQLARAQAANDSRLSQPINTPDGAIFYDRSNPSWRQPTVLTGLWAEGIAASRTEIWLYSELLLPNDARYESVRTQVKLQAEATTGTPNTPTPPDSSGPTPNNSGEDSETDSNDSATAPSSDDSEPPFTKQESGGTPKAKGSYVRDELQGENDNEILGYPPEDEYGFDPTGTWTSNESAYRDDILYSEALLNSPDEVIAYRTVYEAYGSYYGSNESQLIVINNGSFLLNGGLVNRENRKLADRVVASSTGYNALFLESGPDGLEISKVDSPDRQKTPWDFMTVWPFSFIIPHMFVIAAIFYFAFFPIFGRPKSVDTESNGDFGKHITALGKLFASSREGNYMLDRIKHYNRHVKRESGQHESN